MGDKLPFGGALFLHDGTKFIEVEEGQELVTTSSAPQTVNALATMNTRQEFTGTVEIPRMGRKQIMRLLLGWRAKGPLRKRALCNAVKIMRRIRFYGQAQ